MLKELYEDLIRRKNNDLKAETEGLNPDEAGEHCYEATLTLLADETSEDCIIVQEYMESENIYNVESQLSDDIWTGVAN